VLAAARQNKLGFAATALIVFVTLAAAGYGIYAFLARGKILPFQNHRNPESHRNRESGTRCHLA